MKGKEKDQGEAATGVTSLNIRLREQTPLFTSEIDARKGENYTERKRQQMQKKKNPGENGLLNGKGRKEGQERPGTSVGRKKGE